MPIDTSIYGMVRQPAQQPCDPARIALGIPRRSEGAGAFMGDDAREEAWILRTDLQGCPKVWQCRRRVHQGDRQPFALRP